MFGVCLRVGTSLGGFSGFPPTQSSQPEKGIIFVAGSLGNWVVASPFQFPALPKDIFVLPLCCCFVAKGRTKGNSR